MKSPKRIARRGSGPVRNNHEEFEKALRVAACTRPFCRIWPREVGSGYREVHNPDSFFRYGLIGETDMAGILYVRGHQLGVALFIEVKTGAGKLSNDQLNFRNMVRGLGAFYIEARWDGVELMEIAVERVMSEIDRLASF